MIVKHTSASIKPVVLNEIRFLSKASGVSASKIIQFMLKLFFRKCNYATALNTLTEYQSAEKVNLCIVHYCVDEDLVNSIGKYRWLFRMSASKMIFACFLLFWDIVVDHFSENPKETALEEMFHNYEEIKHIYHKNVDYFRTRLIFEY